MTPLLEAIITATLYTAILVIGGGIGWWVMRAAKQNRGPIYTFLPVIAAVWISFMIKAWSDLQ